MLDGKEELVLDWHGFKMASSDGSMKLDSKNGL